MSALSDASFAPISPITGSGTPSAARVSTRWPTHPVEVRRLDPQRRVGVLHRPASVDLTPADRRRDGAPLVGVQPRHVRAGEVPGELRIGQNTVVELIHRETRTTSAPPIAS
jgi:hypothetical protein